MPPSVEQIHADVVVIGGGIAGLAAAQSLARRGAHVILTERKPYFGGRAYSYEHPALETVIDSQHVLLGCCTNLLHLLDQCGAAPQVRWYDELTFLEPGGRASRVKPTWMPAPLHTSIDFLQMAMLSVEDKAGIARGLMEWMRPTVQSDDESMAQWCARTRQTPNAVRRFWKLTTSVTLNDSLENCSVRYGAKVFRELLLKSSTGGRLGIPTVPLSDLFSAVAMRICAYSGRVMLRSEAQQIERSGDRWKITVNDQQQESRKFGMREFYADAVVLAGSFDQAQKMLSMLPQDPEQQRLIHSLGQYRHSPIVTAHLWLDREITEMHHAALLDTNFEWVFNKTRIRNDNPALGSYLELVIGAAEPHLKTERGALLEMAVRELKMFFPQMAQANIVQSAVLKEARATFSVTPGLDAIRVAQETAWPGLYLAGDWTRTDWPATMEGAVRSGYRAAEAVCRGVNAPQQIEQPDIEPTGLMRLLRA